MVPGSRSISICKAVLSRCSPTLHRNIREPLLFLYPTARGFGSSAAEVLRNGQSTLHSRSAPESQQAWSSSSSSFDTHTLDTRPVAPGSSSQEYELISKAEGAQQYSHAASNKDICNNEGPRGDLSPNGRRSNQKNPHPRRLQIQRVVSVNDALDIRRVKIKDDGMAPKARKFRTKSSKYPTTSEQQADTGATIIRNIVQAYPRPIIQKDTFRKVAYGQKVRMILSTTERVEMRWWYQDEVRRLQHENMNEDRGFPQRGPPEVLKTLIRYTPKRVENTLLRISVPDNAVDSLLLGPGNNIMDIKNLTGCDIELLEAEEGKSTRSLLLSGPPICISAAAAHIFRIVPAAVSNSTNRAFAFSQYSTRSTTTDVAQSTDARGSAHITTQYYLASSKVDDIPRRADSIPKPRRLTEKSLELYIRSLTGIKMTSPLHKMLYRKNEDHVEIVAERLLEVFAYDECMDVMTITGLNEAVSFLAKYGRVAATREIFDKARRAGFPLTPETYNILLRGCAKTQNINTFAALLGVMIHSGYRPNSGTWRAFMMVLRNPKAILHVYEAMQDRGLFHEEGLLSDVCELLLPHEMTFCLNKNQLVAPFIENMTSRYGDGWLSVSGANKVLEELGKRGLLSECWSLVDYMVEQNIVPNAVSINTIFTHSTDARDFRNNIRALDRVSEQARFRPDGTTYEILFKFAWRWRLYSTARVIWQRACLDACARFEMRKRVSTSLQSAFMFQSTTLPSLPGPSAPPDSVWDLTAGVFVVREICPPAPKDESQTPDESSLSQWKAFHHAVETVKSELLIFKEWRAAGSLTKLLVASVKADETVSKLMDDDFEKGMEHLLKYAPVVRIKRRFWRDEE
ncbi:hypothetical protein VC83_09258 [Pseudogymnoascus destructans]|uniref:K Homology domain-containing protein n=2 Tax=Pseudogymnoascus destructans TaxID=655981 RepID=L8FT29_PSED2|nr:uncharacterized protein VC83_09258 [Pseudogymnoascus destructans]ELR04037.1 hypothetical protein GMDG_06548 [Pseudogymnoascus destructans 20631-21]OAF54528.1 hypothetical protein VC83_09258 [Pseudogymnoascus destructans]